MWHFLKAVKLFFLPSISLHVLCPVQGSKSCSHAFLLSLLNVPNLHPLLQYRIHGCKISSSWRHLLSFNIPRYCRFSVVRVLFPFKVYGFSKLVLPVYKWTPCNFTMLSLNLAPTLGQIKKIISLSSLLFSAVASVSEFGVSLCGLQVGAHSSCCSW